MLYSRRILILVMVLAIVAAACGGSGSEGGNVDNGGTAAPGATPEPTDPATSPGEQTTTTATAPVAPVAGGDLDWATVDLSSIDWATIDLSTVDWDLLEQRSDTDQIDFEAMSRNPTIGAAGPSGGGGSATFTIDGEVWEFEHFVCAIGPQETGDEYWTFSTSGLTTIPSGTRVQLMAEITDTLEEGRMEGEGTVRSVEVADISDFDNPQVGWYSDDGEGVFGGESGDLVWQFDGNNLVAEGTFHSWVEAGSSAHGRLVATCGR